MYWAEYVDSILNSKHLGIDGITVSIEGQRVGFPKIVKASVLLHEKMVRNSIRKNSVFVFPDGEQIPFLFMLSKVIFDISSGKVENHYSPEKFEIGQILKLGNCVTQFLGVEKAKNDKEQDRIILRFADANKYSVPVEMTPYFQISDTKKHLSKLKKYSEEKGKLGKDASKESKALQDLKALKTHMDESVAYISTIADSERKAGEVRIEGKSLLDYLLVAKADYTGSLSFYKGKLVGTPAILLSSTVSAVVEAVNRGTKVKFAIINLNETNMETQLDALDELLLRKIPVLCIVDTANSMNLTELKNRNFNIWRWDSDSITEALSNTSVTLLDRKVQRCCKSKVEYHSVSDPDISEAFYRIYKYNRAMDNESPHVNTIFSKLVSMAYYTVRNISNIKEADKNRFCESLSFCENALKIEKAFLDQRMYEDFMIAIECLSRFFDSNETSEKTKAIYNFLFKKKLESFLIICSDRDDPSEIRQYWENRLATSGYRPQIFVMCSKAFLGLPKFYVDTAILAGWFSGEIVKKIVYSYTVQNIHVFTYECEEKWKKAHTKAWKIGLNSEANNEIAKALFSKKIEGDVSQAYKAKLSKEDGEIVKQQDDFDLILQESRYRQFTAHGSVSSDQIVNAKAIGFVGGDFALFTGNHKVLVATKIITQISKQIEKKEVDEINIGDFIVVRETAKDIIREVADSILEANHMSGLRKTAGLWREALKIEEAFSPTDDIIHRLQMAGCERNAQTIRNWLQSDDLIIPQDEEDLNYIAEVTGDSVLQEKMKDILLAGQFVKKAHIKAGRILSERLTESIAEKLMLEKNIDVFNIWEPIEIELEDVGTVRILKVVDIGQTYIPVEIGNTNKILSEEKEAMLWQG